MWFARRHTTFSLPRIGKALGGRHHTTVLHGIRAIRRRLRTDARVREARDRINRCLAAWTPAEPIMVATAPLITPPAPEATPPPAPKRETQAASPMTPAADDLPVEFYHRERQTPVFRGQRNYLRAQDDAFCEAMREAGYVEGPAAQGGGQ
jgi:DnaA-like protein